ncbi:yippee-domain-containing protein [Xylona heveae TC161]|uniref:Yippee-domain-containing protein n=1 Tax=Xylona heveae (strain CBS 132557 / TC161) TaxID=1328760 RepID=A0A165A8T4_XYLHT|nr:yippee-domain-containing protein [Xylona heveae TC161]KZF20104.1 yippee-domain-containing protein [Xylona heveae TC161]
MPFHKVTLPPSVFPIYLLPPLPFRRRRKTSTDSNASTDSTVSSVIDGTSSSTSGGDAASPENFLSGHTSRLRCARCATDLCLTSQIISKGFTGRHGRAYLVSGNTTVSLPNTTTHKPTPRQLVTGAHTVSDISCAFCGAVLGWKYVAAEDESQRYKVGKFILETRRVCTASCWEEEYDYQTADDGALAVAANAAGAVPPMKKDEEIEFDSQDEDECEDLFAGVWSSALAARRRKGKKFER